MRIKQTLGGKKTLVWSENKAQGNARLGQNQQKKIIIALPKLIE
jgi:hypothetical protein